MPIQQSGLLRAGALIVATVVTTLATLVSPSTAEAKTPGKTYCFLGKCHRVLSLSETAARVGRPTTVQTSYYDSCKKDRFNPCGLTSSGETFRPHAPDNAASPTLPNGTVIMVRNPGNGKTAILRVNNAGPYWGKRTLDVSRAAADALGFRKRGVANLEVQVVSAPSKSDATYKRNRSYPKVAGPVGAYASLTEASSRFAVASVTPNLTQVASSYPQERTDAADTGRGPNLTGNGIERTWLQKSMTFKLAVSKLQNQKMATARRALAGLVLKARK